KNPYSVGVLSFEEENIDENLKSKLINEFEEVIFAGIEPNNRPPIMWVEHTDKGRIELNYLTFNALQDTRHYQVYYHNNDKNLFNAFVEKNNYEHGFTSVLDKNGSNSLVLKPNKNAPEHKKTLVEELNNEILAKIIIGELKNRNDTIEYIKSKNLIINRIRKNQISIKLNEDDKPISLKGDIYEESRDYTDYTTKPERDFRRDPEVARNAQERFREDFERLLRERQDKHRKRFKSSQKRNEKKPNQSIEGRSEQKDDIQNFELQSSLNTHGVTFSKFNNVNGSNNNNDNKVGDNNELHIRNDQRKEKTEDERFEQLRTRIREAKLEQEQFSNGVEKLRDQQLKSGEAIGTTRFRVGFIRGYVARFSGLLNEILRRAYSFNKRIVITKERKEKEKLKKENERKFKNTRGKLKF
ncbi:hypothetical protein, partial [Providencia sp. MGF014]|uniref:hypothetical protein n=1 Tax=Providencia sp. MGF014 TaxID=2565573 RepID=UPI001447258D